MPRRVPKLPLNLDDPKVRVTSDPSDVLHLDTSKILDAEILPYFISNHCGVLDCSRVVFSISWHKSSLRKLCAYLRKPSALGEYKSYFESINSYTRMSELILSLHRHPQNGGIIDNSLVVCLKKTVKLSPRSNGSFSCSFGFISNIFKTLSASITVDKMDFFQYHSVNVVDGLSVRRFNHIIKAMVCLHSPENSVQ